jgi:hypothetical protein
MNGDLTAWHRSPDYQMILDWGSAYFGNPAGGGAGDVAGGAGGGGGVGVTGAEGGGGAGGGGGGGERGAGTIGAALAGRRPAEGGSCSPERAARRWVCGCGRGS